MTCPQWENIHAGAYLGIQTFFPWKVPQKLYLYSKHWADNLRQMLIENSV